jgi:hypothetical protein
MTGRRRRSRAGRLIALIVVLLLCFWMLHRLFIGIPPAAPPEVKTGAATPASLSG